MIGAQVWSKVSTKHKLCKIVLEVEKLTENYHKKDAKDHFVFFCNYCGQLCIDLSAVHKGGLGQGNVQIFTTNQVVVEVSNVVFK